MTKVRGLLIIIAILVAGLAFDSYKVIHESSGVKHEQVQIRNLATGSLHLSLALERERYDVALSNCLDQNKRNRAGIAILSHSAALKAAAEPLLNTILPARDCMTVAESAISEPGPPIPLTVQKAAAKTQRAGDPQPSGTQQPPSDG